MKDLNVYYLPGVFQQSTTVECRVYRPADATFGVAYEELREVNLQRDLIVDPGAPWSSVYEPESSIAEPALSAEARVLLHRGLEAVRSGQVGPLVLDTLPIDD